MQCLAPWLEGTLVESPVGEAKTVPLAVLYVHNNLSYGAADTGL